MGAPIETHEQGTAGTLGKKKSRETKGACCILQEGSAWLIQGQQRGGRSARHCVTGWREGEGPAKQTWGNRVRMEQGREEQLPLSI